MQDVRKTIGGLGNLMFKQAYLLAQVSKGKIPDVYVQGVSYWKDCQDLIKASFGTDIGYTDKVALHIRRGDYLQAHNFHQNLWETDYYQKATALFPHDKFLVFCKDNQDPDQDKADRMWCRENLPKILGDRWELAPYEQTEVEDLNLMASCKSIIMANSSFSWWAAFLGTHEKVVTPSKWFTDGIQRTELLDEWIKL